jgi:aldehyde dehydrogenase (NAD+)
MDNLMQMRAYFDTGITKPYAFRKEQLKKLQAAVKKYESQLHEALYADLKKSAEECWVTETGFLLSEISNILKHLKGWMEPETVSTNLLNIPSKSFVLQEPLGVVLIISPWNYPFQLLMTPLAGAMAAGNCIVLKSSEFAPATSAVMKQLVEENFDKNYIQFVEGDGAAVIPEMMSNFTFDHVFYTGRKISAGYT